MTTPELRELEMTLNQYQQRSRETAVYARKEYAKNDANHGIFNLPEGGLTYSVLALCGEAGELANKLKKSLRAGSPVDALVLSDELGDVLWYVASVAHELGIDLESVAKQNLAKLADRKALNTLKEHYDNKNKSVQ